MTSLVPMVEKLNLVAEMPLFSSKMALSYSSYLSRIFLFSKSDASDSTNGF